MDDGLKRKGEIEARIGQINVEKSAILMKKSTLENKTIRDLRDRLRGMPEGDPRYAGSRNELSNDLEQARVDLKEANTKAEALEKERVALVTIELPACNVDICAEDVMEHLRQIDQVKMEVQNLQTVIEAQRQSIAEAAAAIPQPIDRQHKRQNLMADIALGNATEADLKTLDDEIAKEQKAIQEATKKAAPKVEKAQAALAGLGRKLAAVQAELQALETKSSEVSHRFFVSEAEKVGAQFVNHALRMKELYTRLVGLDSIIKGHDGEGIMVHGPRKLYIPVFRLPQFEGLENPRSSAIGTFFHAEDDIFGEQIAQSAENEKTRVYALLGVRL